MASTIQRLTMYALLSSLEGDLRDIISGLLPTATGKGMSDDLRKRATDRFLKENPGVIASDTELVDYLDLGDEIQLLRTIDYALDTQNRDYLKERHTSLTALIPIRNRVMHSRPLEFDDYFRVADVTLDLVKSHNFLWPNLRTIIRHLDSNPEYAAGLVIPTIDKPAGEILNNLPQVEFDDTGFLGRTKELQDLRRAILSAYPVVTVVGEGGLGKTALALKACYDLLDDPKVPFDAIVWTTAKANKLTAHEIEIIEGAITSSLGLLESAAAVLGRQSTSAMDDVLLQMQNNKILLVIDNLETIVDNNIRELARRLPGGSKLLFTTRIGLGAFDFPVPLEPLTVKDSSIYFRSTARAWGVKDLSSSSSAIVEGYCTKLHHNPLFIKWFIQSIRAGKRPSSLETNASVLLTFCLQNVFNALALEGRRVASVLAGVSGSQSIASLCFFTDLDSTTIQTTLTILLTSNIVSSEKGRGSEDEDRYVLSPLARMYIQRFIKPSIEEQRTLIAKQNRLRTAQEAFQSRAGRDVFDMNTVFIREKDDYIVAVMLMSAIGNIFAERYGEADEQLKQAYALSPTYFEVHRVRAFWAVEQGDAFEATTNYEAAISLASERAPLRLWYAGFLTRVLGDHDAAFEQLSIAEKLDPTSVVVKLECARVLQIRRKFKDSQSYLDKVANMEGLSAKTRRVHLDLLLQNDIRRAEHHISLEENAPALDALLDVKKRYEDCLPGLIDIRTIRGLQKARRLLPAFRRAYKGLEQSYQLDAFEKWLNELHPAFEARQVRVPTIHRPTAPRVVLSSGEQGEGRLGRVHESYGFVIYKGESLYFSAEHWRGPVDYRLCGEGFAVKLSVGKGSRGWIATNVTLAAPFDEGQIFRRVYAGRVKSVAGRSGEVEIEGHYIFEFHASEIGSGLDVKDLEPGNQVQFGVYKGSAGRWRAKNVQLHNRA